MLKKVGYRGRRKSDGMGAQARFAEPYLRGLWGLLRNGQVFPTPRRSM